jgi:hypothetical protein
VDEERYVNIRKLAALQLYYRGASVKLFEFGFAVFALGGLGLASIVLSVKHSLLIEVIGVYLFFIGVNYIPLLVYGIAIIRAGTVKEEALADESDPVSVRRRYGFQQLLLMVPLFIPLLAIQQETAKEKPVAR